MNSKILGIVVSGLLLSSSAFAASPVATVTAVSGDVKVETLQGKRLNVTPNMQLTEGSTLLVLKGKVNLQYKSTGCKQAHTPNTLVAISETSQCAPGQQLAIGAVGATADGSMAAVSTTGTTGAVATGTTSTTTSLLSGLGLSAGATGAVVAGAVVVGAVVIDNNSSSN